jgi:hypothetical protein
MNKRAIWRKKWKSSYDLWRGKHATEIGAMQNRMRMRYFANKRYKMMLASQIDRAVQRRVSPNLERQ